MLIAIEPSPAATPSTVPPLPAAAPSVVPMPIAAAAEIAPLSSVVPRMASLPPNSATPRSRGAAGRSRVRLSSAWRHHVGERAATHFQGCVVVARRGHAGRCAAAAAASRWHHRKPPGAAGPKQFLRRPQSGSPPTVEPGPDVARPA